MSIIGNMIHLVIFNRQIDRQINKYKKNKNNQNRESQNLDRQINVNNWISDIFHQNYTRIHGCNK